MSTILDYSDGWEGLRNKQDDIICRIHGQMTHFPMCCSTGVLQAVSAAKMTNSQKPVISGWQPFLTKPDLCTVRSAGSIKELIRTVNTNSYILFPKEVGAWYCMSVIRDKVRKGSDDLGVLGYRNYKASSITMFDRLLEDKDRSKGFKYQYNTVWSVDHFQQWLSEQDGQYGEFYLSPPQVGAHGARVRGSLFTPDIKALNDFEEERVELVRKQILHAVDYLDYLSNLSKRSPKIKQLTSDPTANYW